MGISPRRSAPDRNVRDPAPGCPLFNPMHEFPSHTTTAEFLVNNETADFNPIIGFQKL